MKLEINIPKLGAEMQAAEIIEWKVSVGDKVSKGDILCEINAEKMAADVEALYDGEVVELSGQEGETYDVGEVIGYIESIE